MRIALTLILTMCCSQPLSAADLTACRDAKFSRIVSLTQLPPAVATLLGKGRQPEWDGIADRNEKFNAGCVVGAGLGKSHRFVMGVASAECVMVEVENGGDPYNMSLHVFLPEGDTWQAWEGPLWFHFRDSERLVEFVANSQLTIAQRFAAYQDLVDGVLRENADRQLEAVKWFQLAADNHSPEAQYELGKRYEQGHGVPQDNRLAVQWYRRAAEHGHSQAQKRLGKALALGDLGLDRNEAESDKWLRLSAAH